MFYTVHPKSRELNFSLLPWPWQLLPAPFSQEKSVPRCLLDSLRGGRWGKLPAQPSGTLVWGPNLKDLTSEVHLCRPRSWETQRWPPFLSSLGGSVRGLLLAVGLTSSSVLWGSFTGKKNCDFWIWGWFWVRGGVVGSCWTIFKYYVEEILMI